MFGFQMPFQNRTFCPEPFENQTKMSSFRMVLEKMAAILSSHSKSEHHLNYGHGRPFENRTCPVFGSPLY